ncbi:hypothetical protein BCR34DRAFT_563306 [Clohesyomyces aquaticus]|uniref:Peptidase S54 rhomboid domain-containing protein n=1 Tax=Clohesyomyces aquaticus TaxID=1231657 RepID=A0A1Y1ZRA2_9PLEO|nr:hypothetical protein BCR34DRAFT_563306 [Clohesyomyces aquaticus]
MFSLLRQHAKMRLRSIPSAFRRQFATQLPKMPSRFFQSNLSKKGLSSKIPFRRSYSSRRAPAYDVPMMQKNNTIVWAFIGVNTAVHAYSYYVYAAAAQGQHAVVANFFENMTTSLQSVRDEGRWWTIATCCITQVSFIHYLGNMFGFYVMGKFVGWTPGVTPAAFLTLVIGSGLAGTALALVEKSYSDQEDAEKKRFLGFSGVVTGVGTAAACIYPRSKVLIYGIVPVPLWLLTAGFLAYDGYYLNKGNTGVAHAGHLGGFVYGLMFYALRLRGLPPNPRIM